MHLLGDSDFDVSAVEYHSASFGKCRNAEAGFYFSLPAGYSAHYVLKKKPL